MKAMFYYIKMSCAATLLTILGMTSSVAQDIHFSQFNLSPMMLNPGNAGMGNADFRGSISYKNQWPGIAPFTTYRASFDGSVKKRGGSDVMLGLGGSFYKDVAGDVELGTFNASLYVSAILPLDYNSDLSLGLSGGMLQRSMAPQNMIWDNQYVNGVVDQTISSGESYRFAPITQGDVGGGMTYRHRNSSSTLSSNDYRDLTVGVGVMHLNRPNLGWDGSEDRLPMKISAHGDLLFGITNTNFGVRPGFLYSRQGPFQEIVLGSYYYVTLREASKRTGFISAARFSLGTHYRVGDAFIPSVLLEVAEYKLGISYDVNVSALTPATSAKGGIEITFIYTNPATFYYKRKRRSSPMM
jgi:type IX secretion system PorP/SprF family membrane protein